MMMQGSRFKGRILLARTWAHPQWFPGAFFFPFSFLFHFSKIFAYSFNAFRAIQNTKLQIRRLWYQLKWERIHIWETKMYARWGSGLKPYSRDLDAQVYAPKCFSALFLFSGSDFHAENDMDARSILITSLGWWKWCRSTTYGWS